MTYEDKIKYNIEKIRSYIDVLVRSGYCRFDAFAISIAERNPSLYLRNRWQLAKLWNANAEICHAEIATHEDVVRGVRKADSILRDSGHIALKRHILPKDPSEHPLPFFFLELYKNKAYPKLVEEVQGVFRKTTKQYMLPVKFPSALAQASFASLRPYVPECTWEYLFAILGTLNIVFEIKPPRNSIAGNCTLDIIGGIARVTINASSNKWKFLCTALHEISHALNPSRYSPHDDYWKSIYATLLADFYDFFPDEYKSEVVWGMVYAPASLRSTNFYGRAVLFGLDDVEPSPEYIQYSIAKLQYFIRSDKLEEPSAGYRQDEDEFTIRKSDASIVDVDLSFDEETELKRWWFLSSHDLCVPKTIEEKLIKILYAIPYKVSSRVWNLYAKQYGDGAYRYAQNTIGAWIDKSVNTILGYRFFSLVPIIFSYEKRCELCRSILEFSDKLYRRAEWKRHQLNYCFTIPWFRWRRRKESICTMICNHGNKMAETFDYEVKYRLNDCLFSAYWLNQQDMIAYRQELSECKRKEFLEVTHTARSLIDRLESSYSGSEISADIIFPDAEYKVRIIPSLKYVVSMLMPWIVVLGLILLTYWCKRGK